MSEKQIDESFELIKEEYKKAMSQYGNFHSFHEGYAVLLEEVDELWEEIKKRPGWVDKSIIKHEATQIGAMVLKIMLMVK